MAAEGLAARLSEAEAIEADARKALDRFGPRLAQIYGQGESPMTITALLAWRDDPAIEM